MYTVGSDPAARRKLGIKCAIGRISSGGSPGQRWSGRTSLANHTGRRGLASSKTPPSFRLSWWIGAPRRIRCTMIPRIHRQARIHRQGPGAAREAKGQVRCGAERRAERRPCDQGESTLGERPAKNSERGNALSEKAAQGTESKPPRGSAGRKTAGREGGSVPWCTNCGAGLIGRPPAGRQVRPSADQQKDGSARWRGSLSGRPKRAPGRLNVPGGSRQAPLRRKRLRSSYSCTIALA